MRFPTLMIVSSDDDLPMVLQRELQSTHSIHLFQDGLQALAAAQELLPDVLVVDLMLQGIDGITLLRNLKNIGICPMTLAVTRLYNDYVIEAAQELGVKYLIRKPCSPTAVVRHVHDLSRRLDASGKSAHDPREYISEILDRLNFSHRHKGYVYLLESALIMWEHPDISITKELYPMIASRYCGNYNQVERSIRCALNAAWEQSTEKAWEQFSAVNPAGVAQRPSNGHMIARLADHLRSHAGEPESRAGTETETAGHTKSAPSLHRQMPHP